MHGKGVKLVKNKITTKDNLENLSDELQSKISKFTLKEGNPGFYGVDSEGDFEEVKSTVLKAEKCGKIEFRYEGNFQKNKFDNGKMIKYYLEDETAFDEYVGNFNEEELYGEGSMTINRRNSIKVQTGDFKQGRFLSGVVEIRYENESITLVENSDNLEVKQSLTINIHDSNKKIQAIIQDYKLDCWCLTSKIQDGEDIKHAYFEKKIKEKFIVLKEILETV